MKKIHRKHLTTSDQEDDLTKFMNEYVLNTVQHNIYELSSLKQEHAKVADAILRII